MRVLFVIAHLGKGGGLALQAIQLFHDLRREIEVQLVCLDAPGPHRGLQEQPGVSIAGPLVFPKGIWTLSRALRASRKEFDVFHALDPFFATPASYLSGVTPRVVSLGTDPGYEIATRYGSLAGSVARAGMVPCLSGSAVVVNSAALAARFRARHPTVIPNGLDLAKFDDLPTKEEARRMRGLPEDGTLFEYIVTGGYSEEHYGDRYYRALLAAYPDVRSRTHFIGEVPWDYVPSYLAAADVFVYPSPWEGSPNAVIEAMAAGLPAVVS